MFFDLHLLSTNKEMYQALTFYHNLLRWLVLAMLLHTIYRAYIGYRVKAKFGKLDNIFRHWTATAAHLQMTVGMTLYFQSPIVKYFMSNTKVAIKNFDAIFFSVIHSSMMLIAITVLTIGSAKAKRIKENEQKFKTMLIWYSIALTIILIAIPWPFSPLSKRPLFR